jgi:hypothetical protein
MINDMPTKSFFNNQTTKNNLIKFILLFLALVPYHRHHPRSVNAIACLVWSLKFNICANILQHLAEFERQNLFDDDAAAATNHNHTRFLLLLYARDVHCRGVI